MSSVIHRREQILTVYCLLLFDTLHFVGRVAESVKRLTTGWTVRDRILVKTRVSARPDRPWVPPAACAMGTVAAGACC